MVSQLQAAAVPMEAALQVQVSAHKNYSFTHFTLKTYLLYLLGGSYGGGGAGGSGSYGGGNAGYDIFILLFNYLIRRYVLFC